MACERWSLLSECSNVLQLLKTKGLELSTAFRGRLIDAGIERAAECVLGTQQALTCLEQMPLSEQLHNSCRRRRAPEVAMLLAPRELAADTIPTLPLAPMP